MNLYILRHGIAEEASADGDDGARKLTAKGREKLRGVAEGLREFGIKLDVILTSPLARATETAEIVAAAYSNNPPPQVLPALTTGVPPAEAVAALRPFAKQKHVMIVGHEPQLSSLAALLLTGSTDGGKLELKKGGCIALSVAARAEKGGAELMWMLTPRQLRKLRK
jgi:phosphohistidine phosphatase